MNKEENYVLEPLKLLQHKKKKDQKAENDYLEHIKKAFQDNK